jgi:hypothetical protein
MMREPLTRLDRIVFIGVAILTVLVVLLILFGCGD